jgi:predicted GH43/DUF377 family glycosyl hydrolase
MKWKKMGHIFDPTKVNDGIKREWMSSGYSQCPSTQIFDDFIRVYFSCRPEPDSNGQYASYTTYVDLDKNDFSLIKVSENPVMSLGGLGTFDEFAVYPTSTISVDNKIHLYYAGWTRCQSTPYTVSIGHAISDDGSTFTRTAEGPMLTNSVKEPYELSGPKVRKFGDKWFMYYLAGEGWVLDNEKPVSKYKIRLALSDDGIEWTKLNKDIVKSILPEDECQAGPDVIFKNNKYHMFFSYRYATDFKNKERGYKIGYAFSYDGIEWTRDDENVGIELSDEGWDSQMHHYPHVFELNNKIYMIYNGNDFGKYGFGLAELDGDF